MIVTGRTIDDVWRASMFQCVRYGVDYTTALGSYVGQVRRQLPHVMIKVEEPWVRPLAPRMPAGLPVPTTEDHIADYFITHLLGRSENFSYTYGMYIAIQMEEAIAKLVNSKGNTNQCCITVGDPSNIEMPDPPCLKCVSFKVFNGELQMFVYFRSWDLFSGMPENLGGLQLLKEYVLTLCDFPVSDGPIVAASDGLHLYEMYFPLVNQLSAAKIVLGEKRFEEA